MHAKKKPFKTNLMSYTLSNVRKLKITIFALSEKLSSGTNIRDGKK